MSRALAVKANSIAVNHVFMMLVRVRALHRGESTREEPCREALRFAFASFDLPLAFHITTSVSHANFANDSSGLFRSDACT